MRLGFREPPCCSPQWLYQFTLPQSRRISFSPQPLQHLLFLFYLFMVFLDEVSTEAREILVLAQNFLQVRRPLSLALSCQHHSPCHPMTICCSPTSPRSKGVTELPSPPELSTLFSHTPEEAILSVLVTKSFSHQR